MARTLPWLQGPSAAPPKPSRNRAPKRQRIQDPATDSDVSSAPTKPRRNASTRPDRTPSTSPPPAPPSVEPMRAGLSQDDIYIMVEDEFLSTARLYTQHLHHAEYVRLKRLAATRRSALDAIARPVDSITKMREVTKRRKKAEKHAAKTNGALSKMMGEIEARQPRDSGAESDLEYDGEADENARMNAPGVGTVLGDLMKTGASTKFGGLGGLHGVKSSTRAAAGFAKIGSQSQEPVQNGTKSSIAIEEVETSDDDDDLDVPVVRRSKTPATKQFLKSEDLKASIHRPPLQPPTSSTPAQPTTNGHPTRAAAGSVPKTKQKAADPAPTIPKPVSKPPQLPMKALKLPDDDFVRPSSAHTDAVRRRMQARREKERRDQREKQEKMDKPLDMDEIPVFLV